MPLYNYACRSCDTEFSETYSMDDRKIPTEAPCSECGGEIFQKLGTPGFISDSKSMHTRAGSEWQDILKKVKKGSGQSNTIKV